MPTGSSQPRASRPWQGLLPREHGAYFQLALPLLTALVVTGAPVAGLWLSGVALAAFLAHEPLLLVLGQRGARRAEQDRSRAWRWGLMLAGVGTVCLVLGGVSLESDARLSLVVPLVLGFGVLLLVQGRQERTAAGEVLAVLALSSWAIPVMMAGKQGLGAALALWGTFAVAFGLATIAVRTVIHAGRPRADKARLRITGMGMVAVTLALALSLALRFGASPWLLAALAPGGLTALGLCAVLPSPRYLREMGWSLAGSGLLTAVLLALALR